MQASAHEIITAIKDLRLCLQGLGLLLDFNESVIEIIDSKKKRISWAVSGVRPNLSQFVDSSIEEYVTFLKGRHYQAQLIDGSLIQVSYEIKRQNAITGARLVWYPCPIDFELEELETASIEEIVLTTPTLNLGCRAPIRIDFAPHLEAINHSATHMHLGFERTRLPVQRAMEPLRFLGFVLRTAYPKHWALVADQFHTGDWAAQDQRHAEDQLHASLCWSPAPIK